MYEEEWDEEQHLAEVTERLKAGRQVLSMTVYAVQHGRRTPEQVRDVVARAARAIHRNQLVRSRWTQRLAVH